ncbi:MAG: DnaJ domain-containing protein [Rhodospirillaceae bacterium]
MGDLSHDPKGYYTMLGVSENADADGIKSAYRGKAKRLHPDINPSPLAAKQFQRLTEAYNVLSDIDKRAAYDKTRSTKTGQTDSGPTPKARTQAQTKTEPKGKQDTKSKPHQKETQTNNPTSHAQNSTRASSSLKPELCQCGKVTAQPRYVEFDMVAGQGRSVKKKTVSGVFCRTCADRAALKASFVTWLTGWWAIPNGPKETINALLNNVRGGRKPADRNTRLLVHQAKAFQERGDLTLARGTAEQALTYASTPTLRREVDNLLLSLSAHGAKHLKTRWDKPGWAPIAQLMPLIVFIVWLSVTATMSAPTSLTDWTKEAAGRIGTFISGPSVRIGANVSVTTDVLNLRTGPGQDYQVLMILAKDTNLLVTEVSPDGSWVRVSAPDGTDGFVPLRAVSTAP